MPRIFFCYRHADSEHQAGHLFAALATRFGKKELFKDVLSIPPGKNYRAVAEETLRKTDVVLVLVGDAWLSAALPDGTRRLEDADDDVRIEIEAALELLARGVVRVIPVLVGRADMPRPRELPESLRRLAFLKAVRLRPDPDFEADLAQLVRVIDRPGWRRLGTAAAVVGLIAVWIGIGWLVTSQLSGHRPGSPAVPLGRQLDQLMDANQIDAAAALCDQALAEGREPAVAFAYRGRAHYLRALRTDSRAELERAVRDFDEALRLNPADALSYARRAACNARLGNRDRAAADIRSAAAHDTGDDALLYVNLAYVAEIEKDDMRAIEHLGRALEIDRKKLAAAPDDRKAALRERCSVHAAERARFYLKRGYLADCLNDTEESLRHQPNATAFLYRGLIRLDRGQPDEALKDLQEAFHLAPQSYAALYGMGVVYRNRYVSGGGDEESNLRSGVRDLVEAAVLARREGDDGWAEVCTADANRPKAADPGKWRRFLHETARALLERAADDLKTRQTAGPEYRLAGEAERLLTPILAQRPWDFPVRRTRWKAAVVRGLSRERGGEYERAREEYQAASDDGSEEATLALARLAEAHRGGDWEWDSGQQLRELARHQKVADVRWHCRKRGGQDRVWLPAFVTTPKTGTEVARDEVRRLREDHDVDVPEEVLTMLDETLREARRKAVPFPELYLQKLGVSPAPGGGD